jgi:hypothetical protein
MKKLTAIGVILMAVLFVFAAFIPQRTGTVSGRVLPADGASQVWLLTPRDTMHGALKNGSFEIAGVRTGSCVLVIDALAPYKRTVRSGIEVYEGSVTNVGEIALEK